MDGDRKEEWNFILRKEEFNRVKEKIKEYYDEASCGIFDTRNVVGDAMATIFHGKYIQLDICFSYSYFEVLGTTEEEFSKLYDYYQGLSKED